MRKLHDVDFYLSHRLLWKGEVFVQGGRVFDEGGRGVRVSDSDPSSNITCIA